MDSVDQVDNCIELLDLHAEHLCRVTWTDPNGKTRLWESAERATRSKTTGVDAVGICAILEKANGPEILLQKQFRPAVEKVCIEVPAGLVDEGESVETSAVRELKEETGYVGEVVKGGLAITPLMFNGGSFGEIGGCMLTSLQILALRTPMSTWSMSR